jgi:uncharacterized membrane protein YkvA (DUF1232 family)
VPPGLIRDSLVLIRRLLRDPKVPRSRKLALGLLLAYLASPIDLIPDFLPVIGQLDDVLIAGWVLRGLVRASGPGLLRKHWPGEEDGLRVIMRLSGV